MKYPRSYHLSISEGATNDDKMHKDDSIFLNKDIVITAKLDGSNLCFTSSDCFARSHSGPPTHPSFDLAKKFHKEVNYLIPEYLWLFMEYTYAKHSIEYSSLPSYFHLFNVYDEHNQKWLSWEYVEMLAEELGIPTAPVLFKGQFAKLSDLYGKIAELTKEKEFGADEREGVVIRLVNEFGVNDFKNSLAKIVRANHVTTSEHWKHQEITKNRLK